MSDFWSDMLDNDIDRPSTRRVYSVAEVVQELKRTLEGAFFSVLVEGEISNFIRHSSGHCYFTIKDEAAQLSCVMWRGRARNLHFRPADGMKLRITGDITVYERQGRLQLDVQQMMPLGEGDLQQAFEALKQRLADEGLFETMHKKALPPFPVTVGIVTSPTGAAIHDIISVIQRRAPGTRLVISPARVQGAGAAEEIAAAIEAFNQWGGADVLIVGRGGGSLEDLWPFNEEVVARAIYASEVPVVSAVGHESDVTISDFTADVRAATPSAAAELVVLDTEALELTLSRFQQRMQSAISNKIEYLRQALRGLSQSYGLRTPQHYIRETKIHLESLTRQLIDNQHQLIKNRLQALKTLESQLNALAPDKVLERGYTITRDADGHIVDSISSLSSGQHITTQLKDGQVDSKIFELRQDEHGR